MTTTIVLGQNPQENKNKILFGKCLCARGEISFCAVSQPQEYNFIELISLNYGEMNGLPFDLMFAYQDKNKRNEGVLYLGKWNGGIV